MDKEKRAIKTIIIEKVTETGVLSIIYNDEQSFFLIKPSITSFRLIQALILQFYSQWNNSVEIKLSISSYLELCGLKNKKEIRKQLQDDLSFLNKISLSYKVKSKDQQAFLYSFKEMPLCAKMPIIKNSIIIFELTDFFYQYLLSSPLKPLPKSIFKINLKINPNAFYLASIIFEDNNKCGKKKNIISIKTLLEASPSLSNDSARFTQSIKKPFERDMNYLVNQGIIWEYCDRLGNPLNNLQLEKINYYNFIEELGVRYNIKAAKKGLVEVYE